MNEVLRYITEVVKPGDEKTTGGVLEGQGYGTYQSWMLRENLGTLTKRTRQG